MYSVVIPMALSNFIFFAMHISGSGSFPKPLSAKDEHECLLLIKEGDLAARNKLIEHNLRLVAHVIKKYYSSMKEQDDLISIGTIGLIKAVSTFDMDKGTRFATYASRCVENEVLMYFRSKRKTVQDVYLYDPIDTDKDGNALTLGDIMSDDSNILDDIDLNLKSEELHGYMEKNLSRRERDILTMRYGLLGTRASTQKEVSGKLNISRSYVSRIEKKAIAKLKQQFAHSGRTEY